MMNIPPSEARNLPYYEFQAILWNWNDAHRVDDTGDLPDRDATEALLSRINADPRMTGPRAAKV